MDRYTHRDSFVFPAIENNFLGFGSLEAFVANHRHKFIDVPKKGAFKLLVDIPNQVIEENDPQEKIMVFFLVKDIQYLDGGEISFFALNMVKTETKPEMDGSHIPAKNLNEDMLQYFNRVEKENESYWVETIIIAPIMIRMTGRFDYYDDEGIVITENSFASKYSHHIKKFEPKEVSKITKVVDLSSRRNNHDKTD